QNISGETMIVKGIPTASHISTAGMAFANEACAGREIESKEKNPKIKRNRFGKVSLFTAIFCNIRIS
ncbi:MAG: hypothetical protein KUG73_16650, partial [Pseudomonadales bacterium]|nr:hypothetical protein [Pseudomonadales bacterium]